MSFIKAILEQPEPPCDRFNCRWRSTCSVAELSCDAFNAYVMGIPQTYKRRGRIWFVYGGLPTHKRFLRLNREQDTVLERIKNRMEFGDDYVVQREYEAERRAAAQRAKRLTK